MELEKYYNNDTVTGKEIYLAEPDRINLELYNELNYSREIVAKVTKILNIEKSKSQRLENTIKQLEETIQLIKKGRKISKNIDKISFLDYISSDEEESDEISDDRHSLNLESPVIKFPEKVKNPQLGKVNQSFSMSVPKLDLSGVKEKYHAPKHIQIAAVENNKEKSTNRSTIDYIDKLKFQLKVCKNSIRMFKKKIEKYKRIFEVQKNQLISLKNKNELIEMQFKKLSGSTYDEISSHVKRDINDTSMVNLF